MSGLFGELANGVKALTAASRSIETAGRNLANVNNSTYARQRVIYGDRGSVQTEIGVQSLGIEARQIQQLRDKLLDAQVVRESSLKSSYEAEQSAYQRAQADLGQSIDRSGATSTTGSEGSSNGIAQALSDFFNAFQSFAASPTDTGERQALIQKAGILTDGLNESDQRLAQLQSDLTSQVTSDITDVNSMLATIADLNGQIGRLEINQPGSAVDLRDQRQAAVEQLAQKMSIETRADPTFAGQIQVFSRDASNNPVQLINLALVTGPVTLSGSILSAGTPATALVLKGGSINGALTARDGAITNLRTNLNSLASQLVTSVNTAYNPSGATGDFFNAAGTTAGTIAVAGTLTSTNLKASDGGAVGDNTIAQAVANLVSTTYNTPADDINGTFSQFYSKTVTDLGQALTTATSHVTSQTTISNLVRSQRDSVSGVSLDEEMADLIKYQRAFQACSRVVQVIDELLDDVVNRLGA
ncbi:MAG: flagellar hook-associated protein FlgK [Verrucomicrobia bacterium]|nr:flagellar hook-associated protein FlgK [Verrucomicrobiota bacterium]